MSATIELGNHWLKLTLIISSVTISIATTLTVITGHMYPAFQVTFGIGVLLLSGVTLTTQNRRVNVLILLPFMILAVFYRVFPFIYPASLPGADPDKFAFQAAQVLATGEISSITLPFYSNAPGYILYIAEAAQITGLPLRYAPVVAPISIGVVFLLVAYRFSTFLSSNHATIITALSVTTLAPVSIWLSYNPIAQSLATVIAIATLVALNKYFTQPSPPGLIVSLSLFFPTVIFHKLSPTMLLVASIGTVVMSSMSGELSVNSIKRSSLGIVTFALGIGIYFQWIITLIDELTIARLTSIILGIRAEEPPSITPQAAELVTGDSVIRVGLNVGYQLPLLVLGGIGWISVWYHYRNRVEIHLVLSIVATCVGLAVISRVGLVPSASGRFLMLATPFLSSLVGYTVFELISGISTFETDIRWPSGRMIAACSLIILLIGLQSISLMASIDGPHQPRAYLTDSELAGKEWALTYQIESLHTDTFYATEIPPSILQQAKIRPDVPAQYQDATPEFLNREIDTLSCAVAVRPTIEQYSYAGLWRLTYDPVNDLDQDLNRIYSNPSGAFIYYNNSCSSI